jgi:hypothetical protein
MRQFAAILTAVFFIAIASTAYSQSLADLANKEKSRREEIKSDPKVITNEETAKYASGAVTTVELPAPPSPKSDSEKKESATASQLQTDKLDPDEPVDFQGRPESFWRNTMADARQKVKELENEANVLTLKLSDLHTQFYRMDDGFRRETVQREIQKTYYEQDLNKENLAKAKDGLQDLEKEARKSGALPGWLTSQNP